MREQELIEKIAKQRFDACFKSSQSGNAPFPNWDKVGKSIQNAWYEDAVRTLALIKEDVPRSLKPELTDEECIKLLMPHTLQGRVDFWIYYHILLLWRLYRWNWFNVWTGESGFRLFAKHRFKEWKK